MSQFAPPKRLFKRSLHFVSALILLLTPASVFANPLGDHDWQNHTPQHPTTPVELLNYRTEQSQTFLNPNRTFTTNLYPVEKFYKDTAGKWQSIDSSLKSDGKGGFKNAQGPIQVDFPSHLGKNNSFILSSTNKPSVTMSFDDATGTQAPTTKGGNIQYAKAMSNVDVQYAVENHHVKESLVLQDATAGNTYHFTIHAPGVTFSKQKDGSLSGKETKSGKDVYLIPAAFMVDRAGARSNEVDTTISTGTNGDTLVTLTADSDWLKDTKRKYPVIIDPSVGTVPDYANGRDTTISSANPTVTYNNDSHLFVGKASGYGTLRALLNFTNLPNLLQGGTGATITNATLSVYQDSTATNAMGIQVLPATSNWTSSGVSWNTQPTLGAILDTQTKATSNVSQTSQYIGTWNFNVTSHVQNIYKAQKPNFGFELQAQNESNVTTEATFASSDSSTEPLPSLSVTYTIQPMGKDKAWMTTNENVHAAGGDLMLPQTDLSVSGVGPQVSVNRIFNSQNIGVNEGFGAGWSSNILMHLTMNLPGPVLFTDGTGLVHVLAPNSTNTGWFDTESESENLVNNSDGTFTLYQIGGTRIQFNSTGQMTAIETLGPNNGVQSIQFAYDSSRHLSTMTDLSGRVWNVTTNSAGLITKITDPSSRSVTYTYDATNTNLTDVSVTGGSSGDTSVTKTSYQNNSTAPQFVVTNALNNQVKYSWNANGAITSISRTIEENSATTSFAWGTVTSGTNAGMNQVTVSDPTNKTVEYVTNANGNVIQTIVNPSGTPSYSTSYVWDQDDNVTQITDPNNHSMTEAYNANGDLVQYTNATGANSYFSFDSYGNLKGSNNEQGASTHTRYNGSLPTTGLDASGNETVVSYDALGNPTSVLGATGLGNNLVPNSNFEMTNSSNLPVDWTNATSGVSVDKNPNDAIRGTTSLQIQSTSAAHDTMNVMIPVTPNQTYNLSAYLKSSGVTTDSNGYGAGLTVHWFNSAGTPITSEDSKGYMNTSGTTTWVRKYATLTAPNDAAYLEVEADLYGAGTAWFDAIQFESSIANTPDLLLNSWFSDNTADSTLPDNWTTTGFTTGDQLDNDTTINGLTSLLLNGNNSTKSFSQTVNGPQYPVGGFQLSAWALQHGAISNFPVSLTVNYSDGTTGTSTITFSNSTTDWQHQNVYVDAKTGVNISSLTVNGDYSNEAGKAWFNDIEVIAMPKTSAFSPYNFVQNPGFVYNYQNQTPVDDWTDLTPSNGSLTWNKSQSYGETSALQIHPGASGATPEKVANDGLAPFDTTARYTAVGHIHTEGLGSDSAYIEIQALDSKGNILNSYDSNKVGHSTVNQMGNVDWTAVSVTVPATNLPSGTANVRVVLAQDGDPNGGNDSGNSYFDDIRLSTFDLSSGATYDSKGNFYASLTDELGNKTMIDTDANNGFATSVTDANGNKTSYTGNKFNEVTSITLPSSHELTSGPTFHYSYDAIGNLTGVTDPNNVTVRYGYNEIGQLKTYSESVNGVNQVNGYHHNVAGLLTEVDLPNSTSTTMSYNAANQLSALSYYTSTGRNDWWNYSYDGLGNLLSMQHQSDSPTTFTYDANSVLTKVTEPVTGGSNTEQITLDQSGAPTSQTYKVNGGATWTNTQTVDLVGHISSVTNGVQSAYFTYDDHGNLIKSLDDATGQAEMFAFDPTERISHVTYKNGNGLDLSYQRDADGKINQITNNLNGTMITYTYNEVGELTQETTWDGKTIAYTYDNVGNRTSMSITSNGTTTTTNYNYNTEKNRLTSIVIGNTTKTATYDNNGQLLSDGTNTYTWNAANQLSSVQVGSGNSYAFQYDGLGRRVRAFGNTYHYNGTTNQIAYLTNSNNGMVARFTYGATGEPMYLTLANGNTYRYVLDGQGNVMGLIDVTAKSTSFGTQVVSYSYDAWGNVLSSTDTSANLVGTINPYAYRGYVYDWNTGLYDLNARYYNPVTGQFISKDPVTPNASEPLSANAYLYVKGDPVNAVDPDGQDAIMLCNSSAASHMGHVALAIILPQTIDFVSYYSTGGLHAPGVFQGIYDGNRGTHYSQWYWDSHAAFIYWVRYSDPAAYYRSSPMVYINGDSTKMANYAHQLKSNPGNYTLVLKDCVNVANAVLLQGGVPMWIYNSSIPNVEMQALVKGAEWGVSYLSLVDYKAWKLTRTMPSYWSWW